MPLTDLFVSYGDTMAPAGFHKVTLKDGGQATLNRGLGASSSSFLWFHQSPARGDPIVEVKVSESDACPDGFEKIPRDVLLGVEKSAFLFIRRGTDVDPLDAISIDYGDKGASGDGFKSISPPIYSDKTGTCFISLSFSTVSKDAPVKWSAYHLSPGDKCDIEDGEKHWHPGEVMNSGTTKESVRIQILGTTLPRNISLSRSSPRLAESGTHTSRQAGRDCIEQGSLCNDFSKERILVMQELVLMLYPAGDDKKQISNSMTMAEVANIWQAINTSVDSILRYSHSPDLVPSLNTYLKEVFKLLVHVIKTDAAISDIQLELLQKLLLLNENFTWFYTHYAVGVPSNDAYLDLYRDYMLSGPAAVTDMSKNAHGHKSAWGSLTSTISSHFKSGGGQKSEKITELIGCKLLVTNINYFASIGGFDALVTLVPHEKIPHVRDILALIKGLSFKIMRKQYLESLLPQLLENISERLLSLDDQEYRAIPNDHNKDFMISMWKDLEYMMCKVFKDIVFFKAYEQFLLDYAKKLISSQMMNLQMKGMDILNDLIERTVRKEAAKKMKYNMSTVSKSTVEPSWLTSDILVTWLQESDLVNIMLGDADTLKRYSMSHTHDEILKKSKLCLILLAQNGGGCIDRQAQLLWSQGGNKVPSSSGDLSKSRIVFTLLGVLIPYLSLHVFTAIKDDIRLLQDAGITPSSFSDEYCKLIILFMKDIVEHAVLTRKNTHAHTNAETSNNEKEETNDNHIVKDDERDDSLGLNALWNFLITESSSEGSDIKGVNLIFSSVQIAAANALASLLSKSHSRSMLNSYLKKCVLTIDEFSFSITVCVSSMKKSMQTCTGCVLLLKRIIESQDPPRANAIAYSSYYSTQKRSSSQELTRSLIIKNCENKYEILRVLIDFIGKCIHHKRVGSPNFEESKLLAHSIECCMDLLQVVLNNSELELTASQVAGLWHGFHSGTTEDMDMFFKWLHVSCLIDVVESSHSTGTGSYYGSRASSTLNTVSSKGVSKCMTEEAMGHIFLELLGKKYNLRDLNQIGFEAIEKIFRCINGREKKILYSSSKTHFQVSSPELVGWDIFMDAYIMASDVKVVDCALKFLIALQIKLSPTVDKRSIWLDFTAKCLNMLQDIFSNVSSSKVEGKRGYDTRKVGRMIVLLRSFFEGIYKSNIPASSANTAVSKGVGVKQAVVPLRVTVFWKKEGVRVNNTTVYVFKKGSVTVGALRARLAIDLKVSSPQLIRLSNSMRTVLSETHDPMLLESSGISSFVDMTILSTPQKDTANFKPTAPASILADDPDSDQMAPRNLVSSSMSHLSLLFEVLAMPDIYASESIVLSEEELCEISNQAWRLLNLLPTNPDMLDEVKTLGGVLRYPVSSEDNSVTEKNSDVHMIERVGTEKASLESTSHTGGIDWSQVLSTGNLLRQHYKLNIVRNLIAPLVLQNNEGQYVDKFAVMRASVWSEAFMDKGGVNCLKNIVLQTEILNSFRNSMFKQSLSLCVELLGVFLKQRPSVLRSDVNGEGDDHVLLSTKLIQFLRSTVIGSGQDDECIEGSDMYSDEGCKDERPVLKRVRSASQGSAESRPPVSNPDLSAQKLERKRCREARFQKYFSGQTKNTSAEKSDGGDKVDFAVSSDEVETALPSLEIDASLLENILSVLKVLMEEKPFVVTTVFVCFDHLTMWEDVLFVSLLQSSSYVLRDAMCSGVYALCEVCDQALLSLSLQMNSKNSDIPKLSSFFFAVLLTLLPHSTLEVVHCGEYFKLIANLISLNNSSVLTEAPVCDVADELSSTVLAVAPTVSKVTIISTELSWVTVYCVNIIDTLITLSQMLVKHRPLEKSEEDDDMFLQGILMVLKSFFVALLKNVDNMKDLQPKAHEILFDIGVTRHLVNELFYNCLFSKFVLSSNQKADSLNIQNLNSNAIYPKCKSRDSRQYAFDVLNIMSSERSIFNILRDLISPHHSYNNDLNQLSVSKSLMKYNRAMTVPKSTSGYCGIINPSCVCYMNSTLQQLFHVPSFRQGILQFETEYKLNDAEAKDDMMLQLQYLFAMLQESDQAFVDPKPFCFAFKDWDGRPTNVSIQQDASEFLAKFFQQVEGAVMGTESEAILKESFAGSFSNELLATSPDGTPRRSERAEPFYILSVPVGRGSDGGNHCLADALASFIRGEQVEYTWETELKGKNTDGDEIKSIQKESLATTKRTSIKKLPNHLIVHLKRFDFNFETMQQVKINDNFEYPEVLDMYPYTVLGREEQESEIIKSSNSPDQLSSPQSLHSFASVGGPSKEECQYKLAGVVVHVGTAHSGHYYSIVKDRRNSSSNSWFELNDSFVSEFDFEDLEIETFGGLNNDQQSSTQSGPAAAISASKDKLRTKNAFMLVYDRIKVNEENATILPPAFPDVPTSISLSIQKDNESFWNTKSIFDPIYYSFLTETFLPGAASCFDDSIRCEGDDNICKLLEQILRIVFGTFSQARYKKLVQEWTIWLVDRMRRQPSLASALLQLISSSGVDLIKENNKPNSSLLCVLLLDSDEWDIRLCGKKIIAVALVIVLSDSSISIPNDLEPSEDITTQSKLHSAINVIASQSKLSRGEAICLQVNERLMQNFLRYAQISWRKIHVFFTPISVLAKNSPRCRRFMQQRDYLSKLLSLFLCNDTPHPNLVGGDEPKNHKSRSMCEGNLSADFSSLLHAIVTLLPSVESDGNAIKSEADSDIFTENEPSEEDSNEENPMIKEVEKDVQIDDLSSTVSSISFGMMRSSIFMYRLIKALNMPSNKPYVLNILQFVLKDSKELTETCVKIIVSAMKKEDGVGMKPPLRCAMVLCKISDNITGWRVSYVMQQVVIEIKSSMQYIQASDVSITLLLRVCKYSRIAAEWLRLNYNARLTWIESYLQTRKGCMVPQKSASWKPIKTVSGSNAKVLDKSAQAVAAMTAAVKLQAEINLQLLKRILSSSHNGKDKKNNAESSKSPSSILKFSRVSLLGGGYDSDDDPADVVGLRVQIQWKNIFYPGEVASFDQRSGLHMIHYDDGDKQACALKSKVWCLID